MQATELIIFGSLGGILLTAISSLNWRHSLRVALILVLFEGAIRKWVLPGASDLVYFAKDFVLLGSYIHFYRTQPKTSLSEQWPDLPISGMIACCLVLLLATLNPNIGSIFAAVLGLRGYIFYLPICLMIPHLFSSKKELLLNLSSYVLLALPICLLGFAQYRSDNFSVLNTYAGGLNEYGASTFGTSERVRITGTFSYLSGHVVFVNAFFALALALVSSQKVPFRSTILFAVLPCLAANAYMSGARASTSLLAFVTLGFILFASTSREASLRSSVTSVLLASLVVYAATRFFFEDAYNDSMLRMTSVGDTFFYRLWTMPVEQVISAFDKGGLIGCGTGTTSTAVEALRARLGIPRPAIHPGYYDGEMGQVLAEIGVIGFCAWYGLRLAIILGLLKSFHSTRDGTLKTIALVAILLNIPYLLISLVLNHVACVLIWSITGLGFIPLLARQTQRQESRLQVPRGYMNPMTINGLLKK